MQKPLLSYGWNLRDVLHNKQSEVQYYLGNISQLVNYNVVLQRHTISW